MSITLWSINLLQLLLEPFSSLDGSQSRRQDRKITNIFVFTSTQRHLLKFHPRAIAVLYPKFFIWSEKTSRNWLLHKKTPNSQNVLNSITYLQVTTNLSPISVSGLVKPYLVSKDKLSSPKASLTSDTAVKNTSIGFPVKIPALYSSVHINESKALYKTYITLYLTPKRSLRTEYFYKIFLKISQPFS